MSYDGYMLATGDSKGEARLWESTTGVLLSSIMCGNKQARIGSCFILCTAFLCCVSVKHHARQATQPALLW